VPNLEVGADVLPVVKNPLTGQPFPNNQIPANMISSVSQAA
jgi:hypothetical protein